MRLWTRQWSLLLFLLCWTHLCIAEISTEQWKAVLTSQRGDGPCELKEWMESAECGSESRDRHERRVYGRTMSIFTQRDDKTDGNRSSTACTCSECYFNVLYGCELVNGRPVNRTQFSAWKSECDSEGLPTEADGEWLTPFLHERLPLWSFFANDGTFDQDVFYQFALKGSRELQWTVIQIVTPIIVGSCLLVIVVAVLLSWKRYKRLQKTKNYPHFTNYVRDLFRFRAESVHHQGRDGSWRIDGDENDSFYAPGGDNSPGVEVSRWSPSTDTPNGNIPRRQRIPFSGSRFRSSRRRSSDDSVAQSVSLTATVRSIGNRVKELMPWKSRPAYVVNMPPSTSYNIDPDRVTLGSSRRSTRTTKDRSRTNGGGRYATISEDDEHPNETNGNQTRLGKLDTSDDVILIRGDRAHFSINTAGTPIAQPTPNRNETTTTTLGLRVESPSPTVETFQLTPETPGAPPLLPPVPKAPAPQPPPSVVRATPRRTPSPKLHIQTLFDPTNRHSRNVSATNLKVIVDSPSISDLHQQQQQPSSSRIPTEQLRPVVTATSSKSNNPYLNVEPSSSAISYVSLHKPSTSTVSVTAGGVDGVDSGGGGNSSSGIRPLPPQPPFPSPFSPTSPANVVVSSSSTSKGILRPVSGLSKLEPLRRENVNGNGNGNLGSNLISQPGPELSPSIIQPQHSNHHHHHSFSGTSLTPLRRTSNQGPVEFIQPQPNPQPNPHPQSQPQSQPQQQHHYRGWSTGDDNDRASLLMNRSPMSIDDDSIYMATPRDVVMVHGSNDLNHYVPHSNTNTNSPGVGFGFGFGFGFGHDQSWSTDSYTSLTESLQHSPTLSELERDPNVISGIAGDGIGTGIGMGIGMGVGGGVGVGSMGLQQASYVGRESLHESAGWDTSTEEMNHNHNRNPYTHPNRFGTSRTPPIGLGVGASASASASANTGALGLGHKSRVANRSREDMVYISRSDPAMLFPGSVRAAGYLVPMTSPIPSPRLQNNMTLEIDVGGRKNDGEEEEEEEEEREREREREEREREEDRIGGPLSGGTWDTESSGILSVAIHQHQQQTQTQTQALQSSQQITQRQQHGLGHGPHELSFNKRTS